MHHSPSARTWQLTLVFCLVAAPCWWIPSEIGRGAVIALIFVAFMFVLKWSARERDGSRDLRSLFRRGGRG
jgi:hypothetical protein